MPVHANSLANLHPAWTPETAPRNGRPKGVTYPAEWIKGMVGLDQAEIEHIADDRSESMSRRMAAKMVLDTIADEADARRAATREVMDRTTGRATQTVSVQGQGPQATLVQIMDGAAPRAKRVEAKHVENLPNSSAG